MKMVNCLQTKDLVAESLRNEILSGSIEAGEELKQELLADMLGVSRMPVREALQMLEQEGFIERLPNRHMVVATLDAEKIKGIMGTIAAMETEIILQGRHAAGKEPDLLLAGMAKALEQGDWKLAAEYELGYHHTLVRLLEITYIEQLFNKALSGCVAYVIAKQTQEIEKRFQLLSELNHNRKEGASEVIARSVRQYYQELYDNWDRREG